ncbi:hypothetical protein TH24_07370 [Thalassospira xiamenensis]|nr:hypothetical protein TH24_07370 [Thalassospira xiamenensis]
MLLLLLLLDVEPGYPLACRALRGVSGIRSGQDMTQIVSFVSDDTKKATGKQYQFTFIRFFAIRETSLA